jgi:copper(I)-binding protein
MMNTNTRTFRGVAAAGAVLLAGGALAACGDDDSGSAEESGQENASEVSISDPWARTGTAGGNTAVYMEITGGTEASDLVAASVSTDVAAEAQIHETMAAGGMAEESGDGTGDMSGDDMSGDDMGDMSGDSEGEVSTDDTSGDMSGEMDGGEMDGSDGSDGMDGSSGMMTMQEVSAIAIPAGETIALEPGGFHVMLLDLAEDLNAGDSIEVTLSFENGYEETVTAEVRES